MTNIERIREHKMDIAKIKKNVSAMYILSDLTECWIYMQAKIDNNRLTEDEADAIIEEVSAKWANTTMAEVKKIAEMF